MTPLVNRSSEPYQTQIQEKCTSKKTLKVTLFVVGVLLLIAGSLLPYLTHINMVPTSITGFLSPLFIGVVIMGVIHRCVQEGKREKRELLLRRDFLNMIKEDREQFPGTWDVSTRRTGYNCFMA